MTKGKKALMIGMGFTWWAVASTIIGGVIRVKYVTPEYEGTFAIATLVYAFGWMVSVIVCIVATLGDDTP